MINGLTPPLAKAAYVTGGTARALREVAGRKLGAKQLERAEAILCKRCPRRSLSGSRSIRAAPARFWPAV